MLWTDGDDQLDRSCEKLRKYVELLHRVKEKGNILRRIKREMANFIGHILRRNCLLNHTVEEKIGGGIYVTGKRGRRCEQLFGDIKETGGC
jgi:hypothetical protein